MLISYSLNQILVPVLKLNHAAHWALDHHTHAAVFTKRKRLRSPNITLSLIWHLKLDNQAVGALFPSFLSTSGRPSESLVGCGPEGCRALAAGWRCCSEDTVSRGRAYAKGSAHAGVSEVKLVTLCWNVTKHKLSLNHIKTGINLVKVLTNLKSFPTEFKDIKSYIYMGLGLQTFMLN